MGFELIVLFLALFVFVCFSAYKSEMTEVDRKELDRDNYERQKLGLKPSDEDDDKNSSK